MYKYSHLFSIPQTLEKPERGIQERTKHKNWKPLGQHTERRQKQRRKPCKTDNYAYRNGTSAWFLVHH